MNKTKIETVDYTWNPITGCSKGCSYCYARKLASGRLSNDYLVNMVIAPPLGRNYHECLKDPFTPRFWPNRLHEVDVKNPRSIFVCNMGDLFGPEIPESWQQLVFASILANPQHTYQLYTKQPQNLRRWSPYPSNCFVGISAINQTQFNVGLMCLMDIKATIKFISFEPLHSLVRTSGRHLSEAGIKWVIIGGQTKPTLMPHITWVKSIFDVAVEAGCDIFIKSNIHELVASNGLTPYQEIPIL